MTETDSPPCGDQPYGEIVRASGGVKGRLGTATAFVVFLGVVSLFADLTYEGARSISGPYLAVLGASGTVVGIVAGFGELVGYGLRLVSGYLADRTGRYWTLTLVGYAINLLAVPLLAFAGYWQAAAILLIAERVGKGIRTPARDAMLSHATSEMGRGWGFGLHEAMDQIGAVLGPVIVAVVLAARGDYRAGFAVLVVPAVLSIGALVAAQRLYPRPHDLEASQPTAAAQGLRRPFWLYLGAIALVAAGFADFSLMAYHFERAGTVSADWIPLFYAVAMAVDAIAALAFGRLFDRLGSAVLVIVALLTAPFAPLVFFGDFTLALAGTALWGIGMGAQESIMRAAVAAMAPAERRGGAYGTFNAGYGVAWFAGSVLMGILYDRSLVSLAGFSVIAQLASIPLLLLVTRALQPARAGRS